MIRALLAAAEEDANQVYYRVGDPEFLRLIETSHRVFCERHPEAGLNSPLTRTNTGTMVPV